jgi:hypothetical protein
MSKTGYWFAKASEDGNVYLPNGDGRQVIVGESLSIEGSLVLCHNGLHYSEHPFDALHYAKGFECFKIEALGDILCDYITQNKCCTNIRLHVARKDAKEAVLLFARQQATKVSHLWDAPAVVRQFLETGKNADAAADAARAAADAAADAADAYAADAAYAAAAAAYAAADAADAYAAYAAARADARAEFKTAIDRLFSNK